MKIHPCPNWTATTKAELEQFRDRHPRPNDEPWTEGELQYFAFVSLFGKTEAARLLDIIESAGESVEISFSGMSGGRCAFIECKKVNGLSFSIIVNIEPENTGKAWTRGDNRKLAKLLSQGKSRREIGRVLGRSMDAIQHRVSRLGLSAPAQA